MGSWVGPKLAVAFGFAVCSVVCSPEPLHRDEPRLGSFNVDQHGRRPGGMGLALVTAANGDACALSASEAALAQR